MDKLQELKEYIQKEIPEILIKNQKCCAKCGKERDFGNFCGSCASYQYEYIKEYRPITLEDVLRVIDKQKKLVLIDSVGAIRNDKLEQLSYWKLGKTIDDQSEEIIEFLYNLIIKQKKYYEM